MKKYLVIITAIFLGISVEAQESSMTLSLQEAIDFAIKNSYDNKVAQRDIESAKQQKWETTTIGLPQIEATVDYQHWLKQQVTLFDTNGDGINEEFTFGTKQNVNAAVTLRQLIFDGSYIVGLQSARTFLKISQQAKEKTELLTREAVINAYGNVLVTEKSIEIFENNEKILEKNFNDAKKIFENGLNEEEDVEQLEITLGNIKSQLNSLKRLKVIAYQMLNVTLGNDIDTELTLTDNLDSLTETNIDFGLISQSFNLNDHIDYKIAENDRESKRLLMQLEKSKALPTLNAFVNYGSQANSDSFSFFNGNQEWFNYSLLGVSLKVPIFSSFGRSAKTQRAKIDLEVADIRLKETEEKLSLQAKRAKSDYQLSIEDYQTAKKNLNLAERIEKKQRIKFFEGLSTSFDLTQAQNQLYSQQQTFIQSMLDVIAKKAALENALNIPVK
ncbi:TolC family protein [Pseudotenacibaculum haliotis]|uniref:TolC family protein n=1 Tax=Pseudotenacibaculum haliotis TaxID=1862138 RepID=A0ABW5LV64_9FLAO